MKPNKEQVAISKNIISLANGIIEADPYRTDIDRLNSEAEFNTEVDGQAVRLTADEDKGQFEVVSWAEEIDDKGNNDPKIRKTLRIKTNEAGEVEDIKGFVSVREYEGHRARKAKHLGAPALTGFLKVTEDRLNAIRHDSHVS